jgi:hypothetical protein
MKTKTLESMILRMESEEIGKIRDDGVNDWNIVNTLMNNSTTNTSPTSMMLPVEEGVHI